MGGSGASLPGARDLLFELGERADQILQPLVIADFGIRQQADLDSEMIALFKKSFHCGITDRE